MLFANLNSPFRSSVFVFVQISRAAPVPVRLPVERRPRQKIRFDFFMAPTRTRHVPSALLIKLGAAFLRIGRSGNERTRIPPVCGALLRRIDAAHEGLAPHSHPRKQTHKTYTPRPLSF